MYPGKPFLCLSSPVDVYSLKSMYCLAVKVNDHRLIAIMLGRLKMSTEEALQSYNKISSTVFSAENRKPFYRDGKFKSTTLKKEIQNVVRQARYSNDQKLLDPDAGQNSKGNVFVCSMTRINLHSPQCFRTCQGLPNQGPDCKIWEAACATAAAPTFFKAIKIAGPGGFSPDYVDAGLGFNNPTKEVRDEALDLIGTLACSSASEQAILVLHLTTDCESVADELAKEYGSDNTYFRFNVLHGAEGVSLDEWKKMSKVMAHMSSYLRGPEVSREIDRVVTYLCSSLPQTK
ncbi:acyl transferase/acyl hydrolase/lysophospholipase [Armillaria borealis]|uniref:Acyl transferase/acyl hydrolase/lysophospholipase n=1 Tax=Armillaria borealis TaxID=47425 RepID=A0AA39J186_9AGAR|nr:acyl transferase/acyl hydrolase/lysophospholipase [Armillaria borealis]